MKEIMTYSEVTGDLLALSSGAGDRGILASTTNVLATTVSMPGRSDGEDSL